MTLFEKNQDKKFKKERIAQNTAGIFKIDGVTAHQAIASDIFFAVTEIHT